MSSDCEFKNRGAAIQQSLRANCRRRNMTALRWIIAYIWTSRISNWEGSSEETP